LDDEARRRAAQRECVWPARLTRTNTCWVAASVGGNKELTGSDVCRFLATPGLGLLVLSARECCVCGVSGTQHRAVLWFTYEFNHVPDDRLSNG
jgi:hypothetical protein